MPKLPLRLLCLLSSFALTVPLASRADELDQVSYPGGLQGSISVNSLFTRGQTFTVGRSGVLTRVRLALGKANTIPGDALLLDVRPTDESGLPLESAESALGSVIVPEEEIPDSFGATPDFDVDFSALGIPVVEGERLAIVARSEIPFGEPRTIAIGALVESAYDRGAAWLQFPSWTQQDQGQTDWVFETYVPEPDGALAAALVALVALASRRRRASARDAELS